MNFKNEVITYEKKNNKLYQIITREINLSSLDDEIKELENNRINKENQIKELNNIINLK